MNKQEMGTPENEKVDWIGSLPFFSVHLACFLAIFSGFSWPAFFFAIFSYYLRMFGITAGFHRYFSHRSYQTSRLFQFFLAWLGTSAVQQGPLWWAAHHRHHHVYSDKPEDIHSPTLRGFWWSHCGWVVCKKYEETRFDLIKDFAKFPELMWVNKYHYIVSIIYAVLCFGAGYLYRTIVPGTEATPFQFLVWGFFISTTVLYHSTFTINSLSHVWGTRRYETSDTSKNNFILAIMTMGEGWHNNHHRFPNVERQGQKWWEIDVSDYILTTLSGFRIVKSIKRFRGQANYTETTQSV